MQYHATCVRKLFGTKDIPELNYDLKDVENLAKEEINQRVTMTGVQPKISVDFAAKKTKGIQRLTIVGLWGRFILKPPHPDYPSMPEFEAVTMNLAQKCGISVAHYGLIPFRSGELAYISKRFDRIQEKKLAQEDFCQLTETLTEGKYFSSMEKAGKVILRWATNPGLDAVRFLELALFSFLTGNSDMHLKNFSLLTDEKGTIALSPAYDLLPTQLLVPADNEEMALPIGGKKAKFKRTDFVTLGKTLKIPDKAIENTLSHLISVLSKNLANLRTSLLSEELQNKYSELIRSRLERMK